jgi:hypothetical protein
MKKMRTRGWILIASLILFSCNSDNQDNSNGYLEASLAEQWKSDTTGCLNFRENIRKKHLKDIMTFEHDSRPHFEQTFGPPNMVRKPENGIDWGYYIDCIYIPLIVGSENPHLNDAFINKEGQQMWVEFDQNGIISSIGFIQF